MFVKLYLVALVTFFALDMTWLGLIAKNLYREQIGHLLRPDVNWTAAIIFYLLFIGGLVVFVISPAVQKQSLMSALLLGAFFGLITYATYDLTNLATTKDWPLFITIVDLIWGAVLSASVSVVTYFVYTRFIG
ncbi:MAG: DUF2177 family protein [Candidatus Moranbacteria bacterium]|nr:DUF2177 family protein [Candidatus Moranbacteria bacterium]